MTDGGEPAQRRGYDPASCELAAGRVQSLSLIRCQWQQSQIEVLHSVCVCGGSNNTMTDKINIPQDKIAEYSRRRHIRRLSVYGSALRADFDEDSDIDILVEFEPGHVPGLFGIARMERELSALLGGRKVDLRTPEDLSRYFRQGVLQEAEPQYVQG